MKDKKGLAILVGMMGKKPEKPDMDEEESYDEDEDTGEDKDSLVDDMFSAMKMKDKESFRSALEDFIYLCKE